MVTRKDAQIEVDLNYEVFLGLLPSLLSKHRGKYLLMKNQLGIRIFDTHVEALKYAVNTYPGKVYSVQEITDEPVDMGGFAASKEIYLQKEAEVVANGLMKTRRSIWMDSNYWFVTSIITGSNNATINLIPNEDRYKRIKNRRRVALDKNEFLRVWHKDLERIRNE